MKVDLDIIQLIQAVRSENVDKCRPSADILCSHPPRTEQTDLMHG